VVPFLPVYSLLSAPFLPVCVPFNQFPLFLHPTDSPKEWSGNSAESQECAER